MTSPGLSFKRIEIRRMPGFPRGGIDVDDLCRGVNIIYGPNASGKTTLGRAIQTLLRPPDSPREERSLFASLEVDGDACTIDYDLGRVKFQREGIDADPPDLAPADVKDRYVLALHDLIRSEDGTDLAGEIVKEAAGGYDIAAARETLGYKDRPSGKGRLTKDLNAAIEACRDARKRQDGLVAEEKTLADLHRRKAEARAAGVRLEWLDKAITCADATEGRRKARQEVDAFPPQLGKLTGREIDELRRLGESLEAAEARRGEEKLRCEDARRRLDESALPDEGVAPELVGRLRLKCQRLQALASEIQRSNQQRSQAAAEWEQARRNLGPKIDEQQIDRLDLDAVEGLAGLARRAEALRADAAAAEKLKEWLGPDSESPVDDVDALNRGVAALERWIAADQRRSAERTKRRVVLIVAAIAGAVISVLMSLLVHSSWMILLLPAVALLVWALLPQQQSDPRSDARREFERLGVGSVEDWTAEGVPCFLYQLQRRSAAATLRQEKALKWGDLADRLEQLARRQEDFKRRKADWARRLGISPDRPEPDEAWLYLLAAGVNRLQQADQRRAGAEAAVEEATRQHEALLGEINEVTCRYGFEPGGDAEAAASQVQQLDERQQAHRAASADLAAGTTALAGLDEDIRRWSGERAALFERVGLTGDESPVGGPAPGVSGRGRRAATRRSRLAGR